MVYTVIFWIRGLWFLSSLITRTLKFWSIICPCLLLKAFKPFWQSSSCWFYAFFDFLILHMKSWNFCVAVSEQESLCHSAKRNLTYSTFQKANAECQARRHPVQKIRSWPYYLLKMHMKLLASVRPLQCRRSSLGWTCRWAEEENAAGPAAVIATTPEFFLGRPLGNIGTTPLITKGFCRLGHLLCSGITIYYVFCKNNSF